jgi:hypothetical protein
LRAICLENDTSNLRERSKGILAAGLVIAAGNGPAGLRIKSPSPVYLVLFVTVALAALVIYLLRPEIELVEQEKLGFFSPTFAS